MTLKANRPGGKMENIFPPCPGQIFPVSYAILIPYEGAFPFREVRDAIQDDLHDGLGEAPRSSPPRDGTSPYPINRCASNGACSVQPRSAESAPPCCPSSSARLSSSGHVSGRSWPPRTRLRLRADLERR